MCLAFFFLEFCSEQSIFLAKWFGPPSGLRAESPRARRRSQMVRAEQEQRGQLQRALHHQLGRTGACGWAWVGTISLQEPKRTGLDRGGERWTSGASPSIRAILKADSTPTPTHRLCPLALALLSIKCFPMLCPPRNARSGSSYPRHGPDRRLALPWV